MNTMTEEQEEKMIKSAHKYWSDESGSYEKQDIMVDAFVEGYKKAFALYGVVGRSEQLPPTCVMDMPDSKYCDCSNECKWCENIRR